MTEARASRPHPTCTQLVYGLSHNCHFHARNLNCVGNDRR